mgnify:CR=1 FL=1|tara:strand:- start:1067 stop:1255 length:189 start_codon:yes stop_codon:yes gene_type:complete
MDQWANIRGKSVVNTNEIVDSTQIDRYILFKVNSLLDKFAKKYKLKDNPYAEWKIKEFCKFD